MIFPILEEKLLFGSDEAPATMKFFTSMHRTARTWMSMNPAPPLNRGGAMVLGLISHHGQYNPKKATTVSSLARIMHMSTPAITQKINLLEEHGLVRRITQEDDRRVVHIELTKKGKQLGEDTHENMVKHLNNALSAMGTEKSTLLIDLMEEFSTNMETEAAASDPSTPLP